jgi:hypothetical protein
MKGSVCWDMTPCRPLKANGCLKSDIDSVYGRAQCPSFGSD